MYLGYLTCYVVASLFIISIMKMTFKRRRREGSDGDDEQTGARRLVLWLLKSLDYVKILRKDARYDVTLSLHCQVVGEKDWHAGAVENVSRKGCMASIPSLMVLGNRVELRIDLPLDEELHQLSVPAEHIWTSEHQGVHYHGFRFAEMTPAGETVFRGFIGRCRRHHSKDLIFSLNNVAKSSTTD